MKLFVAIDLPWELREQLAGLAWRGIPGARWVRMENYHLTLRSTPIRREQMLFLGRTAFVYAIKRAIVPF